MKTITKYAAATALAGALALTAATPSQARHGYNAAAIGFGVGAAVGAAAAANSGYYYGEPGYYYDDGPYAYEAAPVYVEPAPRVYYRGGSCWHVTNSDHNYGYYGPCP